MLLIQFLCQNARISRGPSSLSRSLLPSLFSYSSLPRLPSLLPPDKNTQEAVSAEGFCDVDLETLCVVLERDSLGIREAKLFNAVAKWSEAECNRRNIPLISENKRQVKDCLGCVEVEGVCHYSVFLAAEYICNCPALSPGVGPSPTSDSLPFDEHRGVRLWSGSIWSSYRSGSSVSFPLLHRQSKTECSLCRRS